MSSTSLSKTQKQQLYKLRNKPWTFCIQRIYDADKNEVYFVGQIKEWRGCLTEGLTLEEVWTNLEEVLELCLETALLTKQEIPQPEE